jgi:hypothetical protein
LLLLIAAEPGVTVKKSERFGRRLFQAAVEIIQEKSPKASFVDFHGCGLFDNVKLTHLDRAILTHPKLIVE